MLNRERFHPIALLAKSLLDPYDSKYLPISDYKSALDNYSKCKECDDGNLLEGIRLAKLVLYYQYVGSRFDPLYYGSLSYYEPLLEEFEREVKENVLE